MDSQRRYALLIPLFYIYSIKLLLGNAFWINDQRNILIFSEQAAD